MKDQHLKGNLVLEPDRLKLRVRPRWSHLPPKQDRIFKALPKEPLPEDRRLDKKDNQKLEEAAAFFKTFLLCCAKCGTFKSANDIQPRSATTWTRVRCAQCKGIAGAQHWLCNCRRPWRACPRHASWPDHAREVQNLSPFSDPGNRQSGRVFGPTAPLPALKGKRSRQNQEGRASPKRRKQTATTVQSIQQAGIRALCRIPSLAARFPHLVAHTGVHEVKTPDLCPLADCRGNPTEPVGWDLPVAKRPCK